MENFQDELGVLVDKYIVQGDNLESIISDLEGEIERVQAAIRNDKGQDKEEGE